jgi:catechol 2,3-dioxygenase-like lactoylglutathione lyase family enzyme
MKRVITFLQTKNPEAAIPFYRDTLGFKYLRDDGFALVFDMDGVMLRIGKAREFTPAPGTVLGWEAEDMGAAVEELVGKGVTFERYSFMQQDERGIQTFPGGDQVAWFKDPDGNVLSISHHVVR